MRTLTKTLGSKAVRLLMSAVLVLGLMPALSVASSPGEAWADDGTVGVWNTGTETYDGYSTCYFVADGHPAWCAEPFAASPGDGIYSYTAYRPSAQPNSREWRALAIAMIAATLDVGWDSTLDLGTPVDGCDKMDPFIGALSDAADSANTDDSFYCRMHVMLSYCFNEAMGWGVDAFHGATNPDEWRYQSEKLWGYALTAADGQGVDGLFSAAEAKEMAAVADNSVICMTHSGNAQNLIWVGYVGEGTGALELIKASGNASVTDGNGCYSVEGAVYGVYSDESAARSVKLVDNGDGTTRMECPEADAYITTNSSGYGKVENLSAGQYWVVETAAPRGYAWDGTVYPAAVSAGQCSAVNGGTVTDQPTTDPVGMMISKVDAETGEASQGDGTLAGAVFEVKYYDGWYDESNLPDQATRTWKLKTGENGIARFDETYKVEGDAIYYNAAGLPTIPLGTVTIEEVQAPAGYLLPSERSDRYSLQRLTDGTHLQSVTVFNERTQPEPVIEGAGGVQKKDSQTGLAAQGDASFAGIEFTIYNKSTSAVVNKDGKTCEPGDAVQTIVTDEAGKASTGERDLPYGSYLVKETKTNESMLNTAEEQSIEVREDGAMYSIDATDDIVRGNVTFEKRDKETDGNWPLLAGDADLAATFSITNKSKAAVVVQGTTYQPGEVVWTGKAEKTDDGWVVRTPDRLLPYGTYEIEEIGRPTGYLGSDQAIEFKIRVDGETVNLGEHTFVNQIARADLTFQKKDESTSKAMANVPFLLANCDGEGNELESHVVVTDKNGIVDTSTQRGDVNAFDSVVSGDSESGYTVDEDRLSAILAKQSDLDTGSRSGVWFGKAHDGSITVQDKTLGALTYGHYKLIELPCSANAGRQLITDEFDVATSDNGAKLDFGTLDDIQPEIHTNAYDGSSADPSDHRIVADDEAKIVDRVTYQDLVPGRTYKMRAELRYADDGSKVQIDGKDVTAETEFTPDNKNGYVELTLAFDGSTLENGRKVVVFEECTWNGSSIAEHKDKDDVEQQITPDVPAIGTQAKAADGTKVVKLDPETAIVDTVGYRNLREGATYKLTCELMDKSTGQAVLDASGNPAKAEKTFAADDSRGTVDVELTFDGTTSVADGASLVCYETLTKVSTGKEQATHKDLADEGQTVEAAKPSIKTTLTDSATSTHTSTVDDELTLTDKVEYSNLIPGKAYTMTGKLMVKKADEQGNVTSEPLTDASGKAVEAKAEFTPDTAHGFTEVTFTFDALSVADGTQTVAFESCERAGVEVAVHADISDEGQTVEIDRPKIGTAATDGVDGDKEVSSASKVTIVDTVSYSGLVPGKEYAVSGKLMVKGTDASFKCYGADGKLILDASEGVESDGQGGYTADGGLVRLEKNADGSYNLIDNAGIAEGVGEISKVVKLDASQVSIQEATEAKALTDADGKEVVASATFTPDHANGSVDVTFEFDGSELTHGSTLVAFESLERSGVEIAVHADIDDEGQSVDVVNPLVSSAAADGLDGDRRIVADADAKLVDTVTYKNVSTKSEYTLISVLMDKETGLPLFTAEDSDSSAAELKAYYAELLSDMGTDAETLSAYAKALSESAKAGSTPALKVGKVDWAKLEAALAGSAKLASSTAFAQKKFTPEHETGTVDVEVSFDASKWIEAEENADAVAFEFLICDGKLVAADADFDSESQEFMVVPSTAKTKACDKTDGDQVVLPSKDCTVVDTVIYTDLIPGKEYTVSGTLMDKSTGKALMVNDKEVTASATFTPNQASGSVQLEFAFDSSALDGHELVAFERVYKDGVEVCAHTDINDASQTVTVDKLNGAQGKSYSKTGLDLAQWAWLIALLAAAGAGLVAGGVHAHRRSRRKQAAGLFGDE